MIHSQIVWDTTGFNDKSEWPLDGSQPFVLSNGDKYVKLQKIFQVGCGK